MPAFLLNAEQFDIEQSKDKAVLDVLRGDLKLDGVKEGCHSGECGACSVLIGRLECGGVTYRLVKSCQVALGDIDGCHIVSIEGLNSDGLNPIQQTFANEYASQCGFCAPGFIVALTSFFLNASTLDVDDAIDAVSGNICRCTGYMSIKRAIRKLIAGFNNAEFERTGHTSSPERIGLLIEWGILPRYFAGIADKLSALKSNEMPVYSCVLSNSSINKISGGVLL